MRNFLIIVATFLVSSALMVGGFIAGREKGLTEGRANCTDDLVTVVKAKLPIPSEFKIHDICYYLHSSLKCSVAYLNKDSVITDGQVLALQPDGTWFYQDQVFQVSVCRRECETK